MGYDLDPSTDARGHELRTKRRSATWAQRGLWLLEQTQPLGSGNHLPVAVRLHGRLDEARLRQAIDLVVARHSMLRTTFTYEHGDLIASERVFDAPLLPPTRALTGGVAEAIARLSLRPIDPCAERPYRMELLRVAEHEHALIAVFHHMIFDGTSKDLLLNDIGTAYASLTRQQRLPRTAPDGYDRQAVLEEVTAKHRTGRAIAYWAPIIERVERSPRAFPPPPARGADQLGGSITTRVGPTEKAGLEAVGRHLGASLYTVLLTLFATMRFRYLGMNDGGVAIAVAMGTRSEETRETIGVFVNEAPLWLEPRPELSLSDFIAHVDDRLRALWEFRTVPFTAVTGRLRGGQATPLETSFGYRRAVSLAPWGDLGVDADRLLPNHGVRWPIAMQTLDSADHVVVRVDFDPRIVDEGYAHGLVRHYRNLVRAATSDPGARLSELPMMSARERAAIIRLGAGPPASLPRVPVHRLFER